MNAVDTLPARLNALLRFGEQFPCAGVRGECVSLAPAGIDEHGCALWCTEVHLWPTRDQDPLTTGAVVDWLTAAGCTVHTVLLVQDSSGAGVHGGHTSDGMQIARIEFSTGEPAASRYDQLIYEHTSVKAAEHPEQYAQLVALCRAVERAATGR